ncbi:MAG: DUF779 domain-containing protein [Chloroflexaceae bacterium]|nr:DUF779 domain-containing protein [Chloroflexaceae bacterium]
MQVHRVSITEPAAALLEQLKPIHGDLLFHQSGGCCDGSSPMCYPRREFNIGQRDVFLGVVAGCPFYIGAAQYEYWKGTHLTVDIVQGRGSGFSVEAPEGVRFIIRSRVYTDAEWVALEAAGEPPRGEQPC